MSPARPVLVGTDGSPASLAAVEWAARTARLHSRPLHVLHIAPPSAAGSLSARRRTLRRIRTRLVTEHAELAVLHEVVRVPGTGSAPTPAPVRGVRAGAGDGVSGVGCSGSGTGSDSASGSGSGSGSGGRRALGGAPGSGGTSVAHGTPGAGQVPDLDGTPDPSEAYAARGAPGVDGTLGMSRAHKAREAPGGGGTRDGSGTPHGGGAPGSGGIVACLVAGAAARAAVLLVVGARGEGGFEGLSLGSTALGVLAYAGCPVALVRPGADGGPFTDPAAGPFAGPFAVRARGRTPAGLPVRPGPAARRAVHPPEVVLALDAHAPETGPAAYACAEAAARGLPLRAVHAWELASRHDPWHPYGPAASDRAGWEAAEVAALDAALRPWRAKFPEVTVVPDVRAMSPARALVRASRYAELLVAGRTAGPPGPAADALAHHARCPVVFLPAARR